MSTVATEATAPIAPPRLAPPAVRAAARTLLEARRAAARVAAAAAGVATRLERLQASLPGPDPTARRALKAELAAAQSEGFAAGAASAAATRRVAEAEHALAVVLFAAGIRALRLGPDELALDCTETLPPDEGSATRGAWGQVRVGRSELDGTDNWSGFSAGVPDAPPPRRPPPPSRCNFRVEFLPLVDLGDPGDADEEDPR
jgi:hypothetical protein